MTKNQLKAKYQEFLKTPVMYVDDVYVRPTVYKERAEDNILEYLHDHNGYGYRVMSFNPRSFTVGYIIKMPKASFFVYETEYHRYYLLIDN